MRVAIWRSLSRLVLGTKTGAIPASIEMNTEEAICLGRLPESDVRIVELVESGSVESYTKTEGPRGNLNPYQIVFRQKHLFRVNEATIGPRSGVIAEPGGSILLDSIGSMNRYLGWSTALPETILKPISRIDGAVVPYPSTGYYHWLLEVLPRTIAVLSYTREKRICLVHTDPFHQFSRKPIECAARKNGIDLCFEKYDRPVRAERAYFASHELVSGYVSRGTIQRLRTTFDEYFAPQTGRKIYISRRKAAKRPIENEIDVEHVLADRGFEIVFSESLDFLDQIALFSSSSYVVSMHGAGLSNLVWMSRGGRVLEIFPSHMLHSCYSTLASSLDLSYRYVQCNPAVGTSGNVDLDELRDSVS